jgi:hypothetical protein
MTHHPPSQPQPYLHINPVEQLSISLLVPSQVILILPGWQWLEWLKLLAKVLLHH